MMCAPVACTILYSLMFIGSLKVSFQQVSAKSLFIRVMSLGCVALSVWIACCPHLFAQHSSLNILHSTEVFQIHPTCTGRALWCLFVCLHVFLPFLNASKSKKMKKFDARASGKIATVCSVAWHSPKCIHVHLLVWVLSCIFVFVCIMGFYQGSACLATLVGGKKSHV